MFRKMLRKYVYGLVIEQETIKAAAIDWHMVQKCQFCQKPIMVECQFCPHCGYNLKEKHTTAQVKIVDVKPVEPPKTVTGVIKSYQLPGERPIQTLGRIWKNEDKLTR